MVYLAASDARPTCLLLFAGCGGGSLGFAKHFRVVGAVDWDKDACASHRMNLPGCPVLQADIRTLTRKALVDLIKLQRVDVVVASPPCPTISLVGKTCNVTMPQDEYFKYAVLLAKELDAKAFVMENVAAFPKKMARTEESAAHYEALAHKAAAAAEVQGSKKTRASKEAQLYELWRAERQNEDSNPSLRVARDPDATLLDVLQACLSKAGFGRVAVNELDAKDYGVPQARRRCLVVAFRDKAEKIKFAWPEPVGKPPRTMASVLLTPAQVDAEVKQRGYDVWMTPEKLTYYVTRKSGGKSYARYVNPEKAAWTQRAGYMQSRGQEALVVYDEDRCRIVSEIPSAMAKQARQLKALLDELEKAKATDKEQALLKEIKPLKLALAKRMRMLTIRECARVQSFEDQHDFVGSASSVYHQIGDALPRKLSLAVALAVYLALGFELDNDAEDSDCASCASVPPSSEDSEDSADSVDSVDSVPVPPVSRGLKRKREMDDEDVVDEMDTDSEDEDMTGIMSDGDAEDEDDEMSEPEAEPRRVLAILDERLSSTYGKELLVRLAGRGKRTAWRPADCLDVPDAVAKAWTAARRSSRSSRR